MRLLSRVVWSEGMHLSQHHFQTQSQYFEDLFGFALGNLVFKPYGVATLEFEAEALANGTVALAHASGLMPDGLPFHFADDPLPAPLEIRELFSPTQDSHLVLLAAYPYQPRQANYDPSTNGVAATRFSATTARIVDETTGEDEKPVALARKNLRLVLDVQAEADMVTLPLARVRRDGTGSFVYDEEFVPPSVRIGGSSRLMRMLGRLVERLDAKAAAMIDGRRGAQVGLAEYASREIVDFWLSHTIHSSLPVLRHLHQARACHPEALYSELARLAGALCTFALHSHPRELPLYDHDMPAASFAALERHIEEHLEVALPTRAVRIALERPSAAELEASSAIDAQLLQAYRDFLVQASPYFHLGAVVDRRCLERAAWFLGVRSALGPGELVTRVPALVKVCSAKHIARLVKDAYPGLALQHVPNPPAQISPRADTQYFRLETAGACWTSIVQTAQVGVYVPASIPGVELTLSVVPSP
jgi:type VI secretion system protein ImpJ